MRRRPDEPAGAEPPAATGDEVAPALRVTVTNAPPGASFAADETLPAAKDGSAEDADIRRGECFGVYRIEGMLARGGMGRVFRATDTTLDRPVALKLIAPHLSGSERLRERLLREARAQAQVHHPNIAHIYGVGTEHGQLYYAMELVDGESLDRRLEQRGPIPVAEALALVRQAALGLREAQRHGFIHRDIKPSNLMLDRHGVLKVLDFGLVKRSAASVRAAGSTPAEPRTAAEDTALTSADIGAIGTPLYMAPEQAGGRAVDFRADIYALGVTLHELIAGAPPFRGVTPAEVASQHAREPRPPLVRRGRRLGTPPIDVLCERMMAKSPDDRFASYDALLAAIDEAQKPPPRIVPRVAAFALDVLLVGALGSPFWNRLPPAQRAPLGLLALTLLFAVCCGIFGRTPGMMALSLELVRKGGGRAGVLRAAARAVVQLGPTAIAALLLNWSFTSHYYVVQLAFLMLFYGPLIAAGAVLVLDWERRALGDFVAGTRVRYRVRPS